MYQIRSGPPTSRGTSEYGTPTVMSHRNPPTIPIPPQYSQRINPLMCCGPPQANNSSLNQPPPSRMISAAGINVKSVNPPSRLVTGASITPAAIVAAPERQVTEPLQHKQTFIYGGSETMEPEDCGWLEPIRLKVHAMEVQQYINPNNPEAVPPFIYNVDHLMECVEIPENWAPESVTGVAALTFENLNTNPPIIQHPLRLESDGSKNGTHNRYIQPIKYHVERIKDKDSVEDGNQISRISPEATSEENNKFKSLPESNNDVSFISSFINKIKNGVKRVSDRSNLIEEEEKEVEKERQSKVDLRPDNSAVKDSNIQIENALG